MGTGYKNATHREGRKWEGTEEQQLWEDQDRARFYCEMTCLI